MPFFPKHVRSAHLVIAGNFMAFLVLASTCNFIKKEKTFTGVVHYSGREFAGAETCAGCHKDITDAHAHTPHALTSVAGAQNVKGSFDSGENILIINEKLKVVMEQTDSGLFQTGVAEGIKVISKPFDITIGSGRKGQSYLYWQDHSLFQLPVSYYTPGHTWSTSPGYPVDQMVFDRSIPSRCLECHSTFFKAEKAVGFRETFNPDQVMLGVNCERCHRPAADHVDFHLRNPGEAKAKHIVNPARLTRSQKLDNCALCHSGLRDNIMPSFSFQVGDNLEDFSYPAAPADSSATLDVHGNQYGLLSASKCFKMSELDCSSCHNVHVKETNRLELFSARCMTCHAKGTPDFCKQPEMPALDLAANCIDCHMPALPSRQVFLRTADNRNSTPFFVRTHLIGVYEEHVKEYLRKITSENP